MDVHVYVHTCVLVVNAPAEIVTPPQDTTINLKGRAIFTCETNGGDVTLWKINGTSLISSEIGDDVVTDSIVVGNNDVFILTIFAKAVYNGITIQCVTRDIGGRQVESEIVTLTVQGITRIYSMVYIYMYIHIQE